MKGMVKGMINVPATVADPQLKVLLNQLREAAVDNAEARSSVTARMKALEEVVTSIPGTEDPRFVTVPNAPSQFRVTGLFQKIILDWAGGTTYLAQKSVAHTEIWRNTVNDRDTAILRSVSVGDVWSDSVENGQGFYYWIRFINTAGVASPWSGGVNGGVFGQTQLRPADVIPVLSNRITTSELALALNSRIDLVDAPGTGLMSRVYDLTVVTTGTAAAVTSLETVSVATAATVQTLTVSIAGHNTAIQNLQTVTATTAQNVGTLSSTVEGQNSTIQTMQTAIGGLSAQWTVKTQVNDLVGGVGFYNNGVVTKFYVNAQEFAVYNGNDPTAISPFFVTGGQVYLNSAMIATATITSAMVESLAVEQLIGDKAAFVTANIADASITNVKLGNLIESTNYTPGGAGWRITKAGNAEFNNGTFRNITATGNITASSLVAGAAIVDTANVAGGAVTSMHYAAGGEAFIPAGSSAVVVSLPITMPVGSSGLVVSAVTGAVGGGSGEEWSAVEVAILKNGVLRSNQWFTCPANDRRSFTLQWLDSDPSGTNTYSLRIAASTRGATYFWPTMTATGGKR
jgi:hypothetical protein